MTAPISVRDANPADAPAIAAMIHELAEYERMAAECHAEPSVLREQLFGPHPAAQALIGQVGGAAAGFALFFATYSTFTAKPGLWLEDLYVRPEHRGAGLGRALLARLAALAVERGGARLEWSVLDWNQPAIGFYTRAGARLLSQWRTCRLDAAALTALAAADHLR